jgi:predicted nucleic acid-binding protein
MDTVYIETSIVSHATARPSSDAATAAMQDQARRWMTEQRPRYAVVTSQLVLAEAARGDADAAARRLAMLADIPILGENPEIDRVADELISRSLIPAVARVDALHLAIAALAGVQYLLTLNCRHIANATVLPGVYRLLGEFGLSGLLVCTPMEFLGGSSDA